MGLLSRLIGKEKPPEIAFVQVDDENFREEVAEQPGPVMLYVWSETCPHCRKMAPNVKEAAAMHPEKIKAVHTNAALAPDALGKLGVRGVPTTFFLNQGKIVERVVGFRPVQFLDELIQTKFGGEKEA
jgi:thioredoxin-like negative regulator of GroEL